MTQPKEQQKPDTSFFKQKWGPFEVWVYLLAAGLALVAYLYYRHNQSQSGTGSGNTVPERLLPPFINQVYTNQHPPEQHHDNDKSHIVDLKKAEKNWDALAKFFHMNPKELAELNPELAKKYEGKNRRIPKGTKVKVLDHRDSD